MESPSENPFASPMVDDIVEANVVVAPDEQIRRDHIRHEKSIKTIGVLYILGSGFTFLICLVALPGLWELMTAGNVGGLELAIAFGVSAIIFGMAVLQVASGIGLFRLKNWARLPAGFFSALSMISVPIGTILGIYFLYLLLSKKGAYVCSDEYKRIIAVTPHVKIKTSWVAWTVLITLLILLAILVGVVVFEFA
ncbi:MAG: hypothetical protein KDA87_13730 [Planctomycetales bacterium]|nr:hypothetical protein [Planctomycetales bacterium]